MMSELAFKDLDVLAINERMGVTLIRGREKYREGHDAT